VPAQYEHKRGLSQQKSLPLVNGHRDRDGEDEGKSDEGEHGEARTQKGLSERLLMFIVTTNPASRQCTTTNFSQYYIIHMNTFMRLLMKKIHIIWLIF